MHVDGSARSQLEHDLGQDLAVGHHDQDLRRQGAERGHRRIFADAPGLQQRKAVLLGPGFHRGRRQVPAPPLLAIGLGDDGRHLVSRVHDRPQGRDREDAAAEEDERS